MCVCMCVCVCIEGKTEEKGFFGGVVQSLVAHILKVVQVGGGRPCWNWWLPTYIRGCLVVTLCSFRSELEMFTFSMRTR